MPAAAAYVRTGFADRAGSLLPAAGEARPAAWVAAGGGVAVWCGWPAAAGSPGRQAVSASTVSAGTASAGPILRSAVTCPRYVVPPLRLRCRRDIVWKALT